MQEISKNLRINSFFYVNNLKKLDLSKNNVFLLINRFRLLEFNIYLTPYKKT